MGGDRHIVDGSQVGCEYYDLNKIRKHLENFPKHFRIRKKSELISEMNKYFSLGFF